MSLKLQLSPFSPVSQAFQSHFSSSILPRVRDSSIFKYTRNASPIRQPLPMFKQPPLSKAKESSEEDSIESSLEKDSIELPKEDSIDLPPPKNKPENVNDNFANRQFINTNSKYCINNSKNNNSNNNNNNNYNNKIHKQFHNSKNIFNRSININDNNFKNVNNNKSDRRNKKIVEVPSIDSQERFFSLGDAIEVNDKSTEAFFKHEPAILLRILYNDTDNSLNLWDFGYLNVFVCEVLGPEQQLEEMGNECAVFIPVDKSTIRFETDDVVVVENPFFLIRDMNPPLLIAPVLYHRPESMRSQPA